MRKPKNIAFREGTFADALRLHKAWLNGCEGGKQLIVPAGFNLSDADLRSANLSRANLSRAYLCLADLRSANLSDANLSDADLSGANLSGANLSDADLSGANLSGANLSDADLSGANLSGCIGNREHVKSMQIERYLITYDATFLQIGCQRHAIERWREFNAEEIRQMGGEAAVDWWAEWKPIIFQIIEMSPATPGKQADPAPSGPAEQADQ